MKLTATVSALILTALASSSGADAANSHAGVRRTVEFSNNALSKAATLAKRVPLPERKVDIGPHHVSFEAGLKKLKRQPLANAQPVAMPGFGSIPSMNDGNMPVVGLSQRDRVDSFGEHNGKQGTAVTSNNVVSVSSSDNSDNSSSSSSSSPSTSSSSSSDEGDDADECEDDGDDDDDECEEDDGDDDDEECEDDGDGADDEDGGDDDEDCEDEEDGSSDSATSESSSGTATATAGVKLGSSSSGSSSSSNDGNDGSSGSSSSSSSSSNSDSGSSSGSSSSSGDSSSSSSSSDECEASGDDTSSTSTSSSDSSSGTGAAQVNLKDSGSSSKQSNGNSSSNDKWKSDDSSSETSSSSSSKSTGSSSSSQKGSSYKGIATWYTQNGNAGACGKVNPDSAKIIALYTAAYDNGANCGRTVMIKNLDDGTSTTATVADECPSCGGSEDIDLSVGAFEAIDPSYQTDGVRNIEWYFTS